MAPRMVRPKAASSPPVSAALEQRRADALLHQRDGAAERRLRGAEPLGGNA
jgi:hypothetical protein